MSNKINKSSNRSFGIVFFVVFLLIGFYPLLNQEELKSWALITSFIFLILGMMKSKILTPFNKIWFKFGIFLGKIVSPLILGLIFVFVVTPTGLIMKVLKKDLLSLKFSKKSSYWVVKKGIKSKMKNQF